MFVPSNYDNVLQESKSGHHLVGSAWGLISFIAASFLVVSLVSYF